MSLTIQAPECSAKRESALWYGAREERVKVTVSERHIESLFCQKLEGTDGTFIGRTTKVCVLILQSPPGCKSIAKG